MNNKTALEFLATAHYVQQLNLEDEGVAPLDVRSSSGLAVAEPARDSELPLLANAHVRKASVPPLDHLSLAEVELKGAVPVNRRVELLSSRVYGTCVCYEGEES